MKFKFVPLLLTASACAFLLLGCQTAPYREGLTSDSLLAGSLSLVPPRLLDESDVQRDVDQLVYALDSAYVGRAVFGPDTVDREIRELRKIRGPLLPAELRDEVDEILIELPDGEIAARLLGRDSKARMAESRRPSVGPNAIKGTSRIWDVRIDFFRSKRILFISMVRFPAAGDNAWDGFLATAQANFRAADFLVLDLRGNPGGDPGKPLELVRQLYGRDFPSPVRSKHQIETPEAYALRANAVRAQEDEVRRSGQPVPASLAERYQSLAASMAKPPSLPVSEGRLPESVTDFATVTASSARPAYDKPIYVLTDAACAAACETVVAALEAHPSAKRVGESTAGVVQFAEPGILILPSSHIEVRIPTAYYEFRDARSLERKGYVPDLRIPAGEDAYATLLEKLAPKK